jgi:hypothetical protein
MKRFIALAIIMVMAGGSFAAPGSARPVSIVHAKVMRDFILRYDDVSYARWSSDGKWSTMYFVKDGFHNRAVYDEKGRWQYSLIYYDEVKMPREVRKVVKREYFDSKITAVEEVQVEAGKAWFIHLEEGINCKIVKVYMDGEMETVEEFFKS